MEAAKAPIAGRRRSLEEFAGAGALVFGGSMILNVAGFIFNAIASRRLGVSDYGSFYALMSLYALATIPVGFFTAVIVKYAAEFRALQDDGHVSGLIRFVLFVFGGSGAAYALASLVFAFPIAGFLHVPFWTVPLVGGFCFTGVVVTALRSLGQGVQDFLGCGASFAFEGLGKIGFVLAFSFIGLTVARGMITLILASAAGIACMLVPLYMKYGHARRLPIHLDWKRIMATTGGAAALAVIAGSMGFADVVLVKHFFSPAESGLYAAASVNGKILLYAVGFIPGILIPKATHRHALGERTRDTLWAALAVVGLAALIGVACYYVGGGFLLRVLNGPAFASAQPLLTPYAGAMAFLALTNALGSYGIATHRLLFAIPLLACTALMFATIGVYHPTLMSVAVELLIGTAAMCATVAAALTVQANRPAHS